MPATPAPASEAFQVRSILSAPREPLVVRTWLKGASVSTVLRVVLVAIGSLVSKTMLAWLVICRPLGRLAAWSIT
jgi:hypothetical protein